MKYIFVITIGTRDVQIHQNDLESIKHVIPDIKTYVNMDDDNFHCFRNIRKSGEELLNSYRFVNNLLKYPMIDEFMDELKNRLNNFSDFIGFLLYTDQQNSGIGHQDEDTLYFKDILIEHLMEKYQLKRNQITSIPVAQDVANIDIQYNHFQNAFNNVFQNVASIEKVYIFPQGGIDQINQALTLRLIQQFRNKVTYFQKPKKQPLRELHFPQLFLTDLLKNILKDHLSKYGFDRIHKDICPDEWVYYLCMFAAHRLSLRYHEARSHYSKILNALTNNQIIKDIKNHFSYFSSGQNPLDENRKKLSDLYISVKIKYKEQNDIRGFLITLFTFSENFEKQFVDEYVKEDTNDYYIKNLQFGSQNRQWEQFILDKFGADVLSGLENENIDLSNPNWKTNVYLFEHLLINDKCKTCNMSEPDYKKIKCLLEKMRGLRNELAHKLSHPKMNDILGNISSCGIKIDDFFDIIDKCLGVNGYGEFDVIKNIIYSHYGF
ncbi:hypothetical protein BXY57_1181 [Thermoflavifilum aggregans]|uniref:Uncharacterized protein n=1 Tax=Thermoflavifilum aggregans TaxID=454188 RepID=A0A2M9CUM9_9BACT|nr:hypothetical protein [Thermoflavifilum aggregans]PJJ75601.1 hypothetical protein BXY57_1181 [Thermoflavifilum aggregans]